MIQTEGSVMVPRRRNAMTTQTLRRSRGPVSVLRRVLVSGPITALTAKIGRRTSGPCGGGKEGPQGRNGSVDPLALRRSGTITKP
jgi:hypothetical protein